VTQAQSAPANACLEGIVPVRLHGIQNSVVNFKVPKRYLWLGKPGVYREKPLDIQALGIGFPLSFSLYEGAELACLPHWGPELKKVGGISIIVRPEANGFDTVVQTLKTWTKLTPDSNFQVYCRPKKGVCQSTALVSDPNAFASPLDAFCSDHFAPDGQRIHDSCFITQYYSSHLLTAYTIKSEQFSELKDIVQDVDELVSSLSPDIDQP
jgi:hypothetical protein